VGKKTQRNYLKNDDLLVKVVRQIGSTLGTVIAKVAPDSRPATRTKRRASVAKRKLKAGGRAISRKKTSR
jgi:hypothetical protein